MSLASKSSQPAPDDAGAALSSRDPSPPAAPAYSDDDGSPIRTVQTDDGDFAAGDNDRRQEGFGNVSVSGGKIYGSVIAVNQGVVNYYTMESGPAGMKLNDGPVSEVKVLDRVLRLPRPPRIFYDRTDTIDSLQSEIHPGGGVWLHGAHGCGLTMLLRQAVNRLVADTLPNGAIYLDGTLEPADLDEIRRQLYIAYHASDVPIAVHPEVARGFLSGQQALFVLDHLLLSHSELVDLADTLRGSAVLIAAEGPAPDSLADLLLRGLPRQDAIRLCSSVAQIDGSEPDVAPLLDRLCAALDDLPLPLVLIGRLLRARGATPAQLVARLDELIESSALAERAIGQEAATTTGDGPASDREPLALAARLSLEVLSGDECAVLTVLAHVGQIELAALAAASQLSAAAIEPALKRLIDLGLATSGNEHYQISSSSVGRVVKQLLPVGDERRRAAAFYAGAASSRAGDLAWLAREQGNLTAAIKTLLAQGHAAQAGTLAQVTQPVLVLGGQWSTWGQIIDLADQAAQQSGDRVLQAWALHERGTRAGLLSDLPAAATHLTAAWRLRLEWGHQAEADVTQHNMEYLGLWPPTGSNESQKEEQQSALPRRLPLWMKVVLAVALLGGALGIAMALINRAPSAVVSATPATGSYPLQVTFDASSSSDPNRGDVLTYIWNFGDGTVLTDTKSLTTHTYAAVGIYTATLQVRDSHDAVSELRVIPITVINVAPQPTIELPASATRFEVGQRLTLRGSAIDTEDGRLPDDALTWSVILHDGDHTDTLLPPTPGNALPLTAPAPEDLAATTTSYLEIQLTATDSLGTTGIITQVVRPDLVPIMFATQPAGLQLIVNSSTITTPRALDSWHGYALQLSAPQQRDGSGRSMVFDAWSDGGAPTHTITTPSATATYTATFKPLTLAFAAPTFSAVEGAGSATITATLNTTSTQSVTVAYVTGDGTAIAGQDYTTISDTLTFRPGETNKTFSVPLTNDTRDEPDETIKLSLGSPGGATLSTLSTATLRIQDDDPPPIIAFSNTNTEVHENAGTATITVVLSTPSEQSVTVDFTTGDGTAIAGQDYTAVHGMLTFQPGEASKTISVPLINDRLNEANETVKLSLSNPSNATFGKLATTTLTIVDDDPLPSVAFAHATFGVKESAGQAQITVILSARSGQPVTIAYTTRDGTAEARSDYTTTSGSLTFKPGETTKTFSVPITGDPYYEADETIALILSTPQNATLGASASATLTIQDDDPPPTIQFSSANYRVNENVGAATITVNLSAPSGKTTTVRYSTGNGTAVAGQDYSAASGSLTFQPGEPNKTFTIQIIDDQLDEPDETVQITLSSPDNATLGQRATTTLTIVDDDVPTVQFKAAQYTMDEGIGVAMIDVVLSTPSWQPIAVDYTTSDGTAIAGQDYTAASSTLTFQPGETSKTFGVPIRDDTLSEGDETAVLRLSNSSNATLGQHSSAELTIRDNEPPMPDLVIANLQITGKPFVNQQGAVEIPIRVVVKNQGNAPASSSKVAIYANRNVVAFVLDGQPSGWYPLTGPLAPGAEVELRGRAVTIQRNTTVSLQAEADSCSGEEFAPAYCAVQESNEQNNMSATQSVKLP